MYIINFFGRASDLYQHTRHQDQKFLRWALIGFSVVVVIFIALVVTNLLFGQRLTNLTRQEKQTQQTLIENQPVEVSYLIFSHKLKAIAQIFERRNNKQQAINYLSNLFGNQVFISGVTYDGESQVLSLNLSSPNIFELESLLQKLDGQDVKENFSSLTKSNIRRNEDGSYDLKLTLALMAATNSAQLTTTP